MTLPAPALSPSTQALERAVKILGGQAATARCLNVSGGLVWQWLNGSALPAKHCPAIEAGTREKGETVSCEELLPETNWLRDQDGRITGYVTAVAQPEVDDPDAGRIAPPVETA